ncbi:MAG: hypothetical protein C5B59_03595 [Bacteroidetes bacterium]|nr:MAG: hypothetical protein C5B59_03595 [Bacteroidota bacterium]
MDNFQKIFPPLAIWFFLPVAVLLMIPLLNHLERSQTKYDFESKSRYVAGKFANAKDRPIVLVIGTSLVECGLDSSEKIESRVKEISGKPIVLVKLFKRGGTLSNFADNMKLLDQLRPDIVVVEANMLSYRALNETFLNEYLYLFRMLINPDSAYQSYSPDRRPNVIVSNKTVEQLRNGLIDSTDISSFRELAAAWQSKGTHFLFVNFPIEKSEEFKKWHRADTSAFNTNLRYLRQKIKLEYFNNKLDLDSTFFCDRTHMSLKGSRFFTNSFCREVALQLKSL